MAITILDEQIYENGEKIDTPITNQNGTNYILGGINSVGTRYAVVYTCYTDKSINQLTFTIRMAGTDGTNAQKYLGMYVTTSMHDEHITTSIGGETFLRFGHICTNRSKFVLDSSAPNNAVGVIKKIIPAGTFYVYIIPGVSDQITLSSWFSKSSELYGAAFSIVETDEDENFESHLIFMNEDEAVFYSDGVSGATKGVGNNIMTITSQQQKIITRVVRYQFFVHGNGCNRVSANFYFTGLYNSGGSARHVPLRFYIGTDPDDHANANSTYTYTGNLTMLDDQATLVGEADVVLLPNTTYYVWVFPADDEQYGVYQWVSDSDSYLELFGIAGLIYIDNGIAYEPYQLFVDDGEKWEPYILYLDTGEEWLI